MELSWSENKVQMKWKRMNMKYEWNENEYVNDKKFNWILNDMNEDMIMQWKKWAYDMKLNCERKWYECEYDNMIGL